MCSDRGKLTGSDSVEEERKVQRVMNVKCKWRGSALRNKDGCQVKWLHVMRKITSITENDDGD